MKHLRIFGCEAYVHIPEEDPDFVKARKTKERARVGMFVRTEGLCGHIFVIWVPSKNRLIRSRDVQFREEIKHLPEESIDKIKEIEEENTYHIIIPIKIQEAEQELNQKPVDSEGELSADLTGYWYATPQSIDHSDEVEEPVREWYPDDIDPDDIDLEVPDPEVPDPTVDETVPKEQENKSSEPVVI